ncbi:phosphoribosylformylglycinamidine synthase [Patescibacteria group bacterium]|nr:phosphoribosylformylglycinamidine synthase [Patescibacteria group bacterium]
MVHRIEVYSKVFDARAVAAKNRLLKLDLVGSDCDLWISDVYTIDKDFSHDSLKNIASMLANPVTQSFVTKTHPSPPLSGRETRNSPTNKGELEGVFTYAIEIGFLPGVTDNIATTARESIEDLLKTKFIKEENVYSSKLFFLKGNITEKDTIKIIQSFYNPLIERGQLKDFKTFVKEGGMDIFVPRVILNKITQVTEVDLDVSDEELMLIGKSGITGPDGIRRGPLALDLTFMRTIQAYFKKMKRKPNDIELESLAQSWSEHCKHTIFADPIDELKDGLYKTYIKGATEEIRRKKGNRDFCVSVFTDNSGGIIFDDEFMVTHKVETHNSPSALDPFGGAVTGIVGVNRDTIGFGLGAKPVANFYGFCFADPRIDIALYKGKNKTQKMLSGRRIMDGVIAGVNSGGNQSGIPTPQGFVYFDKSFAGKPLVFVGTVGLIPRKIKGHKAHLKKAQPGDYIVMVGGRVGKDGIHGATFSSEALDTGSPATAVQLGDPITQKKLSDALIKEARNTLLYNSITDNGAGGLSCSVSEMARESGGCIVELEKVPLKYPHLEPWEIWVSESQERMTLAVPEKNWTKFSGLMKRRGVEATVIGKFTDSGKCAVRFKGQKIMELDMDFLHNGLPKRPMKTKMPVSYSSSGALAQSRSSSRLPSVARTIRNFNQLFLQMLSRPNITSFEFISRQYDHIVQGNAVLGPLQGRGRVNADTSVIRPVLSSQKGVILSQALYPAYSEIDTYNMAASSIDTAIRNAVAAGANPDYISLLDNFCWCSANEPERLYQLKLAAKACFDFAIAYETPFISGKDSMFNDFKGFDKDGLPIKISILPTLLISSFGVIDDITKVVSPDAKMAGDLVYLLGETFNEMCGSEYLAMLKEKDEKEYSSQNIPAVSVGKNRKLYSAVYTAIQKDLIASSISIRHGGLGVALARKAIGGMLGVSVSSKNIPGMVESNDVALYSESQGRILVTVAPANKVSFEKIMKGNSYALIGKVTKEPVILIKGLKGKEIINLSLKKAVEAYRETFKDY